MSRIRHRQRIFSSSQFRLCFMRLLRLFSSLLFAAGKIPIIGPMKKAYRMMKEKKESRWGDIKGSDEEADADEEEDFDENNERTKHVSVLKPHFAACLYCNCFVSNGA